MDVIARVNSREQQMNDAAVVVAKTRGALRRYQVMAIVTGVFLLVLTVTVVVKHVFWSGTPGADSVVTVIGPIHGFIYMVYLVICGDLWTRARWGWGRLATLILRGGVPVLSFVVERRVTCELSATEGS